MDVSEHLLRELTYGLNAALLRLGGAHDADALATVLLAILDREGPRHHEPDLVARWAEQAGLERDELHEQLGEAIEIVSEELDDEEVPWSAHRLLELLASEPFWTLRFDLPGEPLPVELERARGLALPLKLRPAIVAVLDAMELALFEAQQAQRSVHDTIPERVFRRVLAEGLAALEGLERRRGAALVRTDGRLPSLAAALETIQRWKLAVGFDASPDDDDGEWTLRVLERLYGIEWVATPPR